MTTNAESKRFHKRSQICATGILSLFVILLLRLMYLQLIEYHFYATLSKRNVISTIPVKPDRGIIYDRNGVVLAKNIPVYSLMVIPGRVKDLKDTIKALSKIIQLTPEEIKNFDRIVKQYYPYQTVLLKQQLTEQEVDTFYVNQYRFPGVVVQTNMIRNYPLGKATAHVVGYVGRITAKELAEVNPTNYTASDEIGKSGVEAEDEVLLHGVMGSEEAEIDASGKVVRILKKTPAIPGDNIYLTIDSKLQAYAEKLLGENSGAVVAIQPATGQVLALVTKPSFDPNEFVNGISNAQYQKIIDAPDHPLYNRATRAEYAPGSSIKPFIAFGALNDGIINTQDYIFDPGWFRLPGTKHIFHNWVKKGFGWVDVTKAIEVSCDTFFYQLAAVMGIDRLDQAISQFGFGSLTGINLPLEKAGVVPSPAWKQKAIGQEWYAADTVLAGIGQGYILVTPIQLAVATATMAERGLRFQPTVLLKLQQPNGVDTTMQPIIEKPIVATVPTAWQTVIQGMQDVISNPQGTAFPSFQNLGYTAAGKTGTAQVAADSATGTVAQKGRRFQNNHLFIVFAPVDNPQIVVVVVIEHVTGMTQRAVQIGRALLDFYMNELKQQQAAATAQNVSAGANANANTSSTNALALPEPVLPTPAESTPTPAPASPPTTPNLLPAPAGPSLLPSATMQTIESKQPGLPKPTPAAKPKSPSVNPVLLQQQMESKMDAQMDMEVQKPSVSQGAPSTKNTSNANTNSQ